MLFPAEQCQPSKDLSQFYGTAAPLVSSPRKTPLKPTSLSGWRTPGPELLTLRITEQQEDGSIGQIPRQRGQPEELSRDFAISMHHSADLQGLLKEAPGCHLLRSHRRWQQPGFRAAEVVACRPDHQRRVEGQGQDPTAQHDCRSKPWDNSRG